MKILTQFLIHSATVCELIATLIIIFGCPSFKILLIQNYSLKPSRLSYLKNLESPRFTVAVQGKI